MSKLLHHFSSISSNSGDFGQNSEYKWWSPRRGAHVGTLGFHFRWLSSGIRFSKYWGHWRSLKTTSSQGCKKSGGRESSFGGFGDYTSRFWEFSHLFHLPQALDWKIGCSLEFQEHKGRFYMYLYILIPIPKCGCEILIIRVDSCILWFFP